MSKNIVIFNGSPRPRGNTAALIDEFTRGAELAGNTVTRFNLKEMDIRACIGCFKGGKDPNSPCVQKDDMDKIYPAFREADIVVFASPMYFWSFTAQLKIAIDRSFAAMEGENGFNMDKEGIMLIAAGEDSEKNYAPMIAYYETLLENLNWKDRGQVFAGDVMEVGDIVGMPCLEEARKLGASIN